MSSAVRVEDVRRCKRVWVETKKRIKLQASIEKNGIMALVGELLKRQREHLDLSQKDIGDRLNYRYFNFISRIENGGCKIPLNGVADVAKAYGFDSSFILIFIKHLHPDIWEVVKQIKSDVKAFSSNVKIEDIDHDVDSAFKSKLKEFRLPTNF